MSVRIFRNTIVLLVLSLLLAACAPSAAPPAPDKEAAPGEKAATGDKAPKRGGSLVVSTTSTNTADPGFSQTPYTVWYYIGDPMLRRDPETWELQPGVIEKWDVSKDGKEITFKVRQGVKFHNKPPLNGRELEARDIVYVLKSATGQQYPELSPLRFPRKESFKGQKDVVAVDKYTVKVTLENPSISYMHALADYRGTWVYADGIREQLGGLEALYAPSPDKHIGTGPFVMKKFANFIEGVYERNPDYWEKDKPYLDKINYIWVADTSTALAAFIAGRTSYHSISAQTDRDFILKQRKDAVIVNYAPNSCWNRLALNTERKPFDDYRVRRAIYLVMDKKKMGEHVVGSFEGKPSWRYPGPLPFPFAEAIPQEELAKHPLYQGPTPENVAEAQRLMKEAGYEKGFTFEIIGSLTGARKDSILILQDDVQKYLPGVKINLKPMDSEAHRARAASGDFEVQEYCHIHDVTGVAHDTAAFHSQGGRNYPRYKNARLDAILDEADRTLEPAKYKELMLKAQHMILDEGLSFLPTYHSLGQLVLQPWLKGLRAGPGTSYQMGVQDWWFDK